MSEFERVVAAIRCPNCNGWGVLGRYSPELLAPFAVEWSGLGHPADTPHAEPCGVCDGTGLNPDVCISYELGTNGFGLWKPHRTDRHWSLR